MEDFRTQFETLFGASGNVVLPLLLIAGGALGAWYSFITDSSLDSPKERKKARRRRIFCLVMALLGALMLRFTSFSL